MKLKRSKKTWALPSGFMSRRFYSPILLLTALSLTACNGGSSISETDTNVGGVDHSSGDDQAVGVSKLAADDADTLIRSSMMGFYTDTSSATGGFNSSLLETSVDALDSSADVANSAPSSGGEGRFSDTNVQEAGVDESDRVKIDGNIMFALERPSSQYYGIFPVELDIAATDQALTIAPPAQQTDTLSAYRLDQENSATLSRLNLELGNQSPEGMYLHKNGSNRDLVLLSRRSWDFWGTWDNASAFSGLQTRVTWIDANDENNLTVGRTLDVDGQLISSRKIGNRLIMVTRFHPQIDGVVVPYTTEDAEANRAVIESADIASLLPSYTLTSGGIVSEGAVVNNNQCYRSERVSSDSADSIDLTSLPYHNPSVISIISIDLNDQRTSINNTCFIGDSETIYVSPKALYLATTRYNYNVSVDSASRPIVSYYPAEITTEIHKFGFNSSGSTDFKGSGSVSGHLGWYPERKPFRMSEKDDNLRVVTFGDNQGDSPVKLNILREGNGSTMNILSTLPNDSRPEPIGKPGENLYASRFIGDRAYLVTFRVTDPLYVLDVSDPYDPSIAGELELPGYSDYLHPVSDTLLLGVGKDAIAADGTGWGDGRGAFYQGVKLALFDVSDSSNPFVADSRVIGKRGTDSPALYQHHAFSWLPQDGNRNARMAIPLSLHDEPLNFPGRAAWSDWTSNNMLTMEIDVAATAFVDVPDWVFESRDAGHIFSPVTLENDRAVIGADGGLYVIHNGALQYGLWGSEAPVSVTE